MPTFCYTDSGSYKLSPLKYHGYMLLLLALGSTWEAGGGFSRGSRPASTTRENKAARLAVVGENGPGRAGGTRTWAGEPIGSRRPGHFPIALITSGWHTGRSE